MPSNRSISWSAALRDIRSDRAERPDVREERLRTTAGLRGEPAVALSAWRGRSGRRYVVAVQDLTLDALDTAGLAVCIAISEDRSIVAVASGMTRTQAVSWLCEAHRDGATELHVHRLAETSIERAAIVGDLR